MKMLLATDVTVPGGVDRYVTDLAAAFTRNGHEVIVALEQTTASLLPGMIGGLGLEVRFVTQYHRRHCAQLIESASAALLAELMPDGLHVACGSPFSCLGLRAAAAEHGVSTVITEQFIDDQLTLSDHERARIRSSYLRARHVIFVSEGNRAAMQRLIGLRGVAHSVIPNGVDVAAIKLRVEQVAPRQRIGPALVMAASRMAPVKGMDTLVRALTRLRPALVGRLDLYGEGPQRDEIEQLIRDLGLADRAILNPWLDDVVGQMAVHDLFVLPSRAEGMPYVVLEAMAAKIPIVATAVGGTAEALADGRAGLLVTQPTADDLAAAIRRSLTRPGETARRRLAATNRVANHYDMSRQMSRTLRLWMAPEAGAHSTNTKI